MTMAPSPSTKPKFSSSPNMKYHFPYLCFRLFLYIKGNIALHKEFCIFLSNWIEVQELKNMQLQKTKKAICTRTNLIKVT